MKTNCDNSKSENGKKFFENVAPNFFENKFLDVIAQMVSYCDKDLIYRYVNKAYEAFFHCNSNDIIGKNVKDIVGPVAWKSVKIHIANAFQGEEVTYTEEREYPGIGTRYIEGHLIPDFDKHKQLLGCWAILTDNTEKLLLAKALQASENNFRKLVEKAPVAILLVQEGKYTYGNPASAKLLGYETPDQIVNLSVMETIAPSHHELILRRMKRTAKGYENSIEHLPIFRPNGSVVWSNSISVPVEINHKKGILIVGHDITTQKEAEQKLIESEKQKKLILNASRELIAYYNLDLEIIWANEAAAKSVNTAPEALQGKKCYEVWHNQKAPCENCPVICSREDKKPHQATVRTPDERYWNLRSYPVFDERGNLVALAEFGYDITQEQIRDRKLHESEEKFRTIFDNAPLGMFRSTPQGQFIEMNRALANMLGYSTPREAMDAITDIAKQVYAQPPKRMDVVNKLLDDAEVRHFENHYRRKSGEVFVANLYIKSIKDKSGEILFLEGMIEDITSRKQHEIKLKESELKYRNLVENAPVGVVLFIDDKFESCNQMVLDILEFKTPDEFKQQQLQQLIHPDDHYKIIERIEKIRNNEITYPFSTRYRVITKSGSIKHIFEQVSEFTSGKHSYQQSILEDITPIVQLEKSKKRLAMEAAYIDRKVQLLKVVEAELKQIIAQHNYKFRHFKSILDLFRSELNTERHWTIFKENFESLHSDFFKKLLTYSAELTQQDIKHCAFIKMNFETKEIAAMFNVKPSSIQMARVRLKKKLGLAHGQDLKRFILDL